MRDRAELRVMGYETLAWPAVLQVIGATALGVWLTQCLRLLWGKFGWGSRAHRGR